MIQSLLVQNVVKTPSSGTAAPPPSSGGFIINSYGGYSKKGYAPYNPKKKNQDALVMAEDPKTRSLFLCVMDGHGEDGDKVSQSMKGKLANYLFKHRDFATDIKSAIADVIARAETELLRGVLNLSTFHLQAKLSWFMFRIIGRDRFLRYDLYLRRYQG